MKLKSLFVGISAVGMFFSVGAALAQDTILITLGNLVQIRRDATTFLPSAVLDSEGQEIPLYQGDRTNSPAQVVGGFTGGLWNEIHNFNDVWNESTYESSAFVNGTAPPITLQYADGSPVPGGQLWTGRGSDPSPAFNRGNVRWECCGGVGLNLTNHGGYGTMVEGTTPGQLVLQGGIPEDVMTNPEFAILNGPGGTAGHSHRTTTGLRIALPAGDYEVYASGTPHSSRFGPDYGIQTGGNQKLYIGAISATDASDVDLDVHPGLTEIPLTQDNYLTWQEYDNFGKAIVTIGADNHLFVGMDVYDPNGPVTQQNLWDGAAALATIEIRALSATIAGDFDGDGDVDGRDFLFWQRNTSVGSLSDWQANYGASSLGAVSTSLAIPEPSTLALACFICLGLFNKRK